MRNSTLRGCLGTLILLGLALAVSLHLQSFRQALFGELFPSTPLSAEEPGLESSSLLSAEEFSLSTYEESSVSPQLGNEETDELSDDLLVNDGWMIHGADGMLWNIAPASPLLPSSVSTPIDQERWRTSLKDAARGDQLLMRSVIGRVPCPLELVEFDEDFKWVQRITDLALDSDSRTIKINPRDLMRAPIVSLGHRIFSRSGLEGPRRDMKPLPPATIIQKYCIGNSKFGSQVVCIGLFGAESGWLNDVSPGQINCFLNSSEVIALIVNQHHQIDHPKVFSFPLGVRNRKLLGHFRDAVRRRNSLKSHLIYLPSAIDTSM